MLKRILLLAVVSSSCAHWGARGAAALECPEGATAREARTPGSLTAWCETATGTTHGPWIEWAPSGRMLLRRSYSYGRKHGLVTGWHENGRKHTEGEYRHDRREGSWRFWDKAGRPIKVIVYRAGKKIAEGGL